ncbi:MAG: DUF86 domain-containing protein [Bacteroidales bacterium]|nr:DUF86 domain-containing protein [Bacteroidales bacterium]
MRDKLNDPARLELILESISNIEGFLVGTTTCEEFIANKILCHAVVYNLQCIGESVYRLSSEFISSHPQMDWEAIKGLRHVLVHDYYSVNMETVWMILKKDLPKLKEYLKTVDITAGYSAV